MRVKKRSPKQPFNFSGLFPADPVTIAYASRIPDHPSAAGISTGYGS
jgi:hypothetical protein